MLEVNDQVLSRRKLEHHVENRTCYTLNHAELNLFETHQTATSILLSFPEPVLASMITGKKVMHLNNKPAFDFLPGESVIMPSDEIMCIDFPEASLNNPTKCLALRFDKDKLQQTVDQLNAVQVKLDGKPWQLTDYNFHFTNDIAINQIIQRLIFLFTENHASKDLFSDMMIQELLIRILQMEQKSSYLAKSNAQANSDRFSYVINFIRQHLTEDITVSLLSAKANMSESSFYRSFKFELGITPNDFIVEERLKVAESALKNPKMSIKEAYLLSGFNSFSYFCRIFKKKHQMQPSAYKEKCLMYVS